MDNRDRDKLSQGSSSTSAGKVNRETESRKGRESNSDSDASFGQNIGRSEKWNEEPNRRTGNSSDESSSSSSGSGYSSGSGRNSGSSGSSGSGSMSEH
jgi:hypothetical protein